MELDVNGTIDAAIVKMADKARVDVDASKCLHFSQSALNLAQTKSILSLVPKSVPESTKKN